MSRYGYYSHSDQTEADFNQMFASPGFSALQLLDIDSIVDQVKRNPSKFTAKYQDNAHRLIQHPQIITDLFDICLRPQQFSKDHKTEINLDLVYKSVEILTNQQTEDFADYLLGSQSKTSEIEEDEVLQEEIEADKDLTVFTHMFKLLEGKKPIEETPASYLNRILTSMFYIKSSEIIAIFIQRKQLLTLIFEHYYSRSISDIFSKLIELQDSNGFYESEKNSLVNLLPSTLDKQANLQLMTLSLQNFANFFDTLLEKYDDKYDKGKYLNLAREVVNEKRNYLFLIQKSKNHPHNPDVQYICFTALDTMLRFSSGQKLSNINTSKLSESNINLDSSISDIKINSEVIKEIENFIINSSTTILEGDLKSVKIPYYRIIQSINVIDQTFIEKIVEGKFIRRIFNSMVSSPRNNILHNIQKEILIQAIKRAPDAQMIILSPDSTFLKLARQTITEKNSQNCYENQLYHILNTVLNKVRSSFGSIQSSNLSPQVKNQLETLAKICKKKSEFYSTEIGGNPRKEEQSWDCSSNDIFLASLSREQVVKDSSPGKNEDKEEKQDDNIISNGNHWLDSELPLYSDDEEQDEGIKMYQSYDLSNIPGESQLAPFDKLKASKSEPQHSGKELEEHPSFDNKRFETYLNFNVNDLLSQFF